MFGLPLKRGQYTHTIKGNVSELIHCTPDKITFPWDLKKYNKKTKLVAQIHTQSR